MTLSNKELVQELRIQWKRLWLERVDDKVRAEGVAVTDYTKLFVEKGTVVHATKAFKPLDFKEILDRHRVENADRYIQPTPQIGGWNKFIKTAIASQKPKRTRRAVDYAPEKKAVQQPKKGGRGWLHR